MGTQRRIRDIAPAAVLLSVILGAAGCRIPAVRTTPELAALQAKTGRIETVQLAKQSQSPPVSIEQATKELARQVTEPNQPRPVANLTLEEVRAAALANNLDLQVQLVNPALAQQTVDVERARFESVFRASASYATAELPGGDSLSSRAYRVGIDTPLQTGGRITAGLPIQEAGGVAEAAASVSVVQSLLRGAGTRINTYYIQIAGYQKGAVDALTKLQAISILGNADIAYWRLYAARKQLDVGREQYKLAQNQLRHAHLKVEAGSAPKIEIVYAEAGLSSRLDAVISAETAVRDFERDLKRIMSRPDMPLNSPVEVNTVTDPDPKGLDLDQGALVEAALANRMELAELEFRLAIGDIDLALARNNRLPLLDLEYAYVAGGQAGNVGGAFEDLFRDPLHDHRIGLSATIPLGNRAAEARLRRARLAKVQDEVSRDRQEQRIRQEVYDAVDGLQQNWRRILAAEQGVITAYRNYRVRQSQFQVGRTDSTEVLRAAESLAVEQFRRIRAFAEYEIAQVLLARATGTLLGHGQVQLSPVVLEGK
ncbi:MAG: TolC family protein, partial [Planctomycetes bacterium]|nr:TolC family protein [Planctomycetota bacterium]